jgi:hypothetical protein
MRFDKEGKLEFADVPGSGVSRVDPNAASGNPRHDTRSGKFGEGPGAGEGTPPPGNVDPLAWARMQDAVRDAAREFEDFDEGDVQEFLKARARDPSVVDNTQFLEMVRQQHLNDIADILDQQLRGSGSKPTAKRRVKVTAPRGYLRRALAGLSSDEVAQVMHRLEARGHDRDDVDNFFGKKGVRDPDAQGKRDAIEASDLQLPSKDGDIIVTLTSEDEIDYEKLGNAIAQGLGRSLLK